MVTATRLAEYRKTQADIATLAEREIESFFNHLDVNNPLRTRSALELFLPELIQQYGDIGATVARDFYDELRGDAGVKTAFRSVLGETIPLEAVQANARWAIGPLFQTNADAVATISNLTLVTDRMVKQVGRNTIHENVIQDPTKVGYARVPSGVHTCAFCLVLASRGAVYETKNSAGENNKYHGKCDCVPTPVWEGQDLPEGYDPDGLLNLYQSALKESDSSSLKGNDGVLAKLREQHGIA